MLRIPVGCTVLRQPLSNYSRIAPVLETASYYHIENHIKKQWHILQGAQKSKSFVVAANSNCHNLLY